MPIHNVTQGDCFLSIAEANGFFWETLWNHPENKTLKAERKDPAVLLPGDKVFVPDNHKKDVSGQRIRSINSRSRTRPLN